MADLWDGDDVRFLVRFHQQYGSKGGEDLSEKCPVNKEHGNLQSVTQLVEFHSDKQRTVKATLEYCQVCHYMHLVEHEDSIFKAKLIEWLEDHKATPAMTPEKAVERFTERRLREAIERGLYLSDLERWKKLEQITGFTLTWMSAKAILEVMHDEGIEVMKINQWAMSG